MNTQVCQLQDVMILCKHRSTQRFAAIIPPESMSDSLSWPWLLSNLWHCTLRLAASGAAVALSCSCDAEDQHACNEVRSSLAFLLLAAPEDIRLIQSRAKPSGTGKQPLPGTASQKASSYTRLGQSCPSRCFVVRSCQDADLAAIASA